MTGEPAGAITRGCVACRVTRGGDVPNLGKPRPSIPPEMTGYIQLIGLGIRLLQRAGVRILLPSSRVARYIFFEKIVTVHRAECILSEASRIRDVIRKDSAVMRARPLANSINSKWILCD
jgi:hypothetical protein